MNRAIKVGPLVIAAWAWMLRRIAAALGLLSCLCMAGCSHPVPPPPPATSYDLSWGNPNTIPVCATPPAFPCQLNQTVKSGTTSTTIAISAKTYPATAGVQYQVIINAYNPAGVLVSSTPSTVTVP